MPGGTGDRGRRSLTRALPGDRPGAGAGYADHPPAGGGSKAALSYRAPAAHSIQRGWIRRCRGPINPHPAGAVPAGVAQDRLPQMRRGDDPVSHAPGGGGRGSGWSGVAGDGVQLLPEQDQAGCEDV